MQPSITEINDAPGNRLLFNQTLPSSTLQLTVIVPVRNEAHHLTDTLDALRKQLAGNDLPLDSSCYEVLLLANNCTDHSYEVARRYQRQYPAFALHIAQIQLPPNKANIGTVRRLLMDEAYRRLTDSGNPNGIIASTDGDTIVDQHWIHSIMLEISNGNDAVGGRILTHPDQSQVRLYHLRDVMYRTLVAKAEAQFDPCLHDPWPRHFQHFGASIAVTCRMYDRVGRLPEKPFLEDEAFYRALIRMDAKVRKSPLVKVYTSTRTQGRVAVGFSEQLRYWSAMTETNQCQLAQPAEAVITQLRNRQQLRLCWQQRKQPVQIHLLQRIANELLIDFDWLAAEIRQNSFFGSLWEKVEEKMTTGAWATHWQPVPITVAIQNLRSYLAS
ncbi:glycosyltransferase [Spirosoma fluviale]|uniref:Glycosyl transferase family 2 n=1 Tax=Spirosoma fluviale TaxID=1597977 RepID=A0A286F8U5_9BACT|nr:glycosyltransferase family A protein [Spirosoma fluviale]SOD79630.1 Glycosyl transferase family 2 [Spirosoma fluviale]